MITKKNSVGDFLHGILSIYMEYILALQQTIQGISYVDVVLVLVLLFYAFEGFTVGIVNSLLDSFSFLAALTLGFMLYKPLGDLMEKTGMIKELALPLSFLAIALMVEGLIRLVRHSLGIPLGKLQTMVPRSLHLVNQVLGMAFGVLTGGILLMSVLTAISVLPISPTFKQALQKSHVTQYLLQNAQGLEGTVSQVFGKPPTDLMTFFTIDPQDQSATQLGFTVANAPTDTQAEQEMFLAVNAERQKNGLEPLTLDMTLTSVARAHGSDMLSRGYFAHNTPEGETPFDRMSAAGIVYTDAGENLAFSQSVALAMNGLMHSPGHRANILSDKFHKIGVGVIEAGWYGEMFVQEFTN